MILKIPQKLGYLLLLLSLRMVAGVGLTELSLETVLSLLLLLLGVVFGVVIRWFGLAETSRLFELPIHC